jgi:hypothetical protein
MAGTQKLYPRATVKKIVKAHSQRNVSKNVDVLVSRPDASLNDRPVDSLQVFLDYILFLQTYAVPFYISTFSFQCLDLSGALPLTAGPRLMKEAGINAKQAGERGISAKSVKKVTEVRHTCGILAQSVLTVNWPGFALEIQRVMDLNIGLRGTTCERHSHKPLQLLEQKEVEE